MTLWFTRDHEWINIENGEGTVGITDYAQKQLGDVVFVELPQIGTHIEQGAPVAVVESVKAASDVYAPMSGEVFAVNDTLAETPGLVNEGAMSSGWFFRMRLDDESEVASLLTEAAYREHIEALQ